MRGQGGPSTHRHKQRDGKSVGDVSCRPVFPEFEGDVPGSDVPCTPDTFFARLDTETQSVPCTDALWSAETPVSELALDKEADVSDTENEYVLDPATGIMTHVSGTVVAVDDKNLTSNENDHVAFEAISSSNQNDNVASEAIDSSANENVLDTLDNTQTDTNKTPIVPTELVEPDTTSDIALDMSVHLTENTQDTSSVIEHKNQDDTSLNSDRHNIHIKTDTVVERSSHTPICQTEHIQNDILNVSEGQGNSNQTSIGHKRHIDDTNTLHTTNKQKRLEDTSDVSMCLTRTQGEKFCVSEQEGLGVVSSSYVEHEDDTPITGHRQLEEHTTSTGVEQKAECDSSSHTIVGDMETEPDTFSLQSSPKDTKHEVKHTSPEHVTENTSSDNDIEAEDDKDTIYDPPTVHTGHKNLDENVSASVEHEQDTEMYNSSKEHTEDLTIPSIDIEDTDRPASSRLALVEHKRQIEHDTKQDLGHSEHTERDISPFIAPIGHPKSPLISLEHKKHIEHDISKQDPTAYAIHTERDVSTFATSIGQSNLPVAALDTKSIERDTSKQGQGHEDTDISSFIGPSDHSLHIEKDLNSFVGPYEHKEHIKDTSTDHALDYTGHSKKATSSVDTTKLQHFDQETRHQSSIGHNVHEENIDKNITSTSHLRHTEKDTSLSETAPIGYEHNVDLDTSINLSTSHTGNEEKDTTSVDPIGHKENIDLDTSAYSSSYSSIGHSVHEEKDTSFVVPIEQKDSIDLDTSPTSINNSSDKKDNTCLPVAIEEDIGLDSIAYSTSVTNMGHLQKDTSLVAPIEHREIVDLDTNTYPSIGHSVHKEKDTTSFVTPIVKEKDDLDGNVYPTTISHRHTEKAKNTFGVPIVKENIDVEDTSAYLSPIGHLGHEGKETRSLDASVGHSHSRKNTTSDVAPIGLKRNVNPNTSEYSTSISHPGYKENINLDTIPYPTSVSHTGQKEKDTTSFLTPISHPRHKDPAYVGHKLLDADLFRDKALSLHHSPIGKDVIDSPSIEERAKAKSPYTSQAVHNEQRTTLTRTPPHKVSRTPPHNVSHTPPHNLSHTPPHNVSHTPPHNLSQTPPHNLSHTPPHNVSYTHPISHSTPLGHMEHKDQAPIPYHSTPTKVLEGTSPYNPYGQFGHRNQDMSPYPTPIGHPGHKDPRKSPYHSPIGHIGHTEQGLNPYASIGPFHTPFGHPAQKEKDPSSYIAPVGQKKQIERAPNPYHTPFNHPGYQDLDRNPYQAPIGHTGYKEQSKNTYHPIGYTHKGNTKETRTYPSPISYGAHKKPDPGSFQPPFTHPGHKERGPVYHTPLSHEAYKQAASAYHHPVSHTGHKDKAPSAYHSPIGHTGQEKHTGPYQPAHVAHKELDPRYHAQISHPGHKKQDPGLYHAPLAHKDYIKTDTNPYPFGHTAHKPDPSVFQHPGLTEHKDYAYHSTIDHTKLDSTRQDSVYHSFGHMGHVDTMYNPYSDAGYSFEPDNPFGYMGYTQPDTGSKPDGSGHNVGHNVYDLVSNMDTSQTTERHVSERETRTSETDQDALTSATHMLL